ncbi:MAG TPA: hypothetical protein DCQ83_09005 [Fibrobacteres bacterium]|jgi:transglutaminase-like putative cysteine protease|nr:hypothetical protein [Fibrobacterota bacterium]
MRFRVKHTTVYRYELPVALGKHVLRMHPRPGDSLIVESCEISIYPRPQGHERTLDADGNVIHIVGFEGQTQELRVSFLSCGEMKEHVSSAVMPIHVEEYLKQEPLHISIRAFFEEIAREAGPNPKTFLEVLNLRLHRIVRSTPRQFGEPLAPEITLRMGEGSCRDLAVLFMACCRQHGIPARFVSGYVEAGSGQQQHMHAWIEAWQPETGWRGYDPTRGIETGTQYLAVAAAADYRDAAPLAGSFTGPPTRSEMTVDLTVEMS